MFQLVLSLAIAVVIVNCSKESPISVKSSSAENPTTAMVTQANGEVAMLTDYSTGRLMCFMRGVDNNLYCKFQNANKTWPNWTKVNLSSWGSIVTGPITALATSTTNYVIFRGPSGYRSYNWSVIGYGPTGSVPTIGLPTNTPYINNCTIAATCVGNTPYFFEGSSDNQLYWYNGANGAWWNLSSGVIGSAGKSIVAGVLTSPWGTTGMLQVFVKNSANQVVTLWQSPNTGWNTTYQTLGTQVITGDLALGKNQDGHLELFGNDNFSRIWHNWQVTGGTGWSGWTYLLPGGGGAYDMASGTITVGSNADGRLELFYPAYQNMLSHNWQIIANGGWNPAGITLAGSNGWIYGNAGAVATSKGTGNRRIAVCSRYLSGSAYYIDFIDQASENGPGWNSWITFPNP